MAGVFADAGYRTGIFRNWPLGDNDPFRPHDRGFQEVVTPWNRRQVLRGMQANGFWTVEIASCRTHHPRIDRQVEVTQGPGCAPRSSHPSVDLGDPRITPDVNLELREELNLIPAVAVRPAFAARCGSASRKECRLDCENSAACARARGEWWISRKQD